MLEWAKKITFMIVALCIFMVAAATKNAINQQALTAIIYVNQIKNLKTSEHHGDEIYLAVTSFFSDNKHPDKHVRIPDFPLAWPSNHLDQIKELKVWQHELKEGEAVTVAFTLIEQDSPPWNTDDLIGLIRLHLKNQQGTLIHEWSNQTKKDSTVLIGKGAGEYELKLTVKQAS